MIQRLDIEIFDGDVTTLEVDAIQNAANGRLIHGAGVAGAIARAGDPVVQTQSTALVKRVGPIPLGMAAVTCAGPMPAKHVIHAITMAMPGGRTSIETVKDATRATLAQAENLGAESLALVALGTGVGRVDPQECANAMVREVYRARAIHQYSPTIVFAVPHMVKEFEEAVARWS